VLALEDLGEVEDMTQLYATGIIEDHIAKKLIEIIATIHRSKPGAAYPLNARLRQLNHQHIFVLPFLEDNGFELDEVQPGLQELSLTYKQDKALKKEVESVGNRYLAEGDTLLHGDYYPGSWMTANNRVYVIDPEFSFMGFPEFDLGVMSAHCVMATMDPGILQRIMDGYSGQAETKLVEKVAGIEIIRRLIGLAQLPLTRTLDEKAHLLQLAGEMVME
jgi:5-methylthioribose kinase